MSKCEPRGDISRCLMKDACIYLLLSLDLLHGGRLIFFTMHLLKYWLRCCYNFSLHLIHSIFLFKASFLSSEERQRSAFLCCQSCEKEWCGKQKHDWARYLRLANKFCFKLLLFITVMDFKLSVQLFDVAFSDSYCRAGCTRNLKKSIHCQLVLLFSIKGQNFSGRYLSLWNHCLNHCGHCSRPAVGLKSEAHYS